MDTTKAKPERPDAIARATKRATGPDGKLNMEKFNRYYRIERADDLQHEDDLKKVQAIRRAARHAYSPAVYIAVYEEARNLCR